MIVQIALPLILAFIMFSLGLGLRKEDFTRVLTFPRAFATGLLNQLILLPLVAFGVVNTFGFSPEFAVGFMILALCPGGVTSNVLSKLAGGNTPLSISLTAITSLISIVSVPVLVVLFVRHFMGADAPPVNVTQLGLTMFLITAIPVAIGMIITAKSPGFVQKQACTISRIALVLFVLIIIAAVAKNWSVFSSNLGTLAPGAAILIVVMLVIGLITSKLTRLGPPDSTAISLESGIQNGTLAIAVGSMVAGVEGQSLPPVTVPAAVYSIVMYVICVPFVLWRRGAPS